MSHLHSQEPTQGGTPRFTRKADVDECMNADKSCRVAVAVLVVADAQLMQHTGKCLLGANMHADCYEANHAPRVHGTSSHEYTYILYVITARPTTTTTTALS